MSETETDTTEDFENLVSENLADANLNALLSGTSVHWNQMSPEGIEQLEQ